MGRAVLRLRGSQGHAGRSRPGADVKSLLAPLPSRECAPAKAEAKDQDDEACRLEPAMMVRAEREFCLKKFPAGRSTTTMSTSYLIG